MPKSPDVHIHIYIRNPIKLIFWSHLSQSLFQSGLLFLHIWDTVNILGFIYHHAGIPSPCLLGLISYFFLSQVFLIVGLPSHFVEYFIE